MNEQTAVTETGEEVDLTNVSMPDFNPGAETPKAPARPRGRPPKNAAPVKPATESTKAKDGIDADVERAEIAQEQLLVQLRKSMEQSSGPDGVSFGQAWGDERHTLVATYVPEALPKRGPNGETTAQMGNPYYGQTMDTMFDEYGDGRRKHNQHIREGWVPVVDPKTNQHVQTRGGNALYERPIEFRIAKDKAVKEMGLNEIPNDVLRDSDMQDGLAYNETKVERKGG